MKKIISILMISAAGFIASSSFAATDVAKANFKATEERAEADFKVAKAKCDALKDNAKDICVEEAKVVRTRSKAVALVTYDNTAKNHTKAAIDVADAEYALAEEKCDDKSGNDKDVCKKEAKAAQKIAIADAKAGKKIFDAKVDAATTANDANYKVAIEKCDAMSGPSKDACVSTAKNQYK
ncbi:hypothetical protein [Undibacterium umbellatum]|uniref:Cell envelope biogenesis protein TolA n=1 Tax=Undibacterium umbellatum TaxID=2762300 RepID=A0ABR6Z664_9BURK|nr:hypothetical protein [Undibacterium umbellatum]MBC3907133.1 hypothetical protein [Undibacterium umbellatum]